MIETVHGHEPAADDITGGTLQVQYDAHGGPVGIGITLDRINLERYLRTCDDDQLVVYTLLERPATNRLVRLLRKARDTAFGADA